MTQPPEPTAECLKQRRLEDAAADARQCLQADPFQKQYAAASATLANHVKALKGEPGVGRLRVGDWRVLFNADGEVIATIRLAPRGGAYD